MMLLESPLPRWLFDLCPLLSDAIKLAATLSSTTERKVLEDPSA